MSQSQRRMIIILALLNFLNFMDRQVVYPLFSHIKADFGLSDTELGLLATVFIVVFSLSTIPLGIVADRYARKVVIAAGVAFWSLATALSGAARGFLSLLSFRSLVGVGEASYAPAATAMIADNFSHKLRARVQGIFYMGSFLGGTIGAIIGGLIVFYTDSWRLAFLIVAIPGFLLAAMALRLKDKKVDTEQVHIKEFGTQALFALKNPAYIWILVSGTLQAFAAGAYITWGIEYVHRYTTLNLRDASITLGLTMLVAGVLGVTLGSYLADRLQERNKAGRSWAVSVASLISVPLILAGFTVGGTSLATLPLLFFGVMFFSFYLGPTAAIVHDITAPKVRATAFAVYIFIVHLLGQASGPTVIGGLSDAVDLRYALQMATLVLLAGAVAFIPVAWRIHKGHITLHEDD